MESRPSRFCIRLTSSPPPEQRTPYIYMSDVRSAAGLAGRFCASLRTPAFGHPAQHSWGGLVLLFLLFVLSLAVVPAAEAQVQVDCSAPPYNGMIDGDVRPVPPSNVKIDTNCTIQNYPG